LELHVMSFPPDFPAPLTFADSDKITDCP